MNVYEITIFCAVYHGENGDKFASNNSRMVVVHALNEELAKRKITLKPAEDKLPYYKTGAEFIYEIKKTGTVVIRPYYEYSDGRAPKPVKSVKKGGIEMNKLTCRGCNKELDNCTCNVLTTSKERTEKLKLIEIYDPCIPCEKEHNGECFDMECHSNARYNAKVSGAKLQMESDQLVVDNLQARIKDLESINESHQKLNGELRERIKELEELILTKDEII